MEFLLFLTAKEKEIVDLIYKAGFSIEENTPLCLLGKKYVGFTKKKQRVVVICTDNIKAYYRYPISNLTSNSARRNSNIGISIRKAVRHEATHVAQDCNDSKLLGIVKSKGKIHYWYKRNAIKGSTSIGKIKEEREEEAYYMEDRPKKLISALKKYCL